MDTTPARGEVSAGILRVGGCDVNPLPLSRQDPPPLGRSLPPCPPAAGPGWHGTGLTSTGFQRG